MNAQAGEEFYGQLLPIDGDRVLLPAVAVREALQMDRIELNTGSPAWLLGFATPGGIRLPVVSLEGLMGRAMPARSSRTRMARIVSISGGPGWMMMTQGQPHLTPLNNTALQAAPLEARDPLDLVLSRGKIANLSAFIPDVEEIERRIEKVKNTDDASALPDWQPAISPGQPDQP